MMRETSKRKEQELHISTSFKAEREIEGERERERHVMSRRRESISCLVKSRQLSVFSSNLKPFFPPELQYM